MFVIRKVVIDQAYFKLVLHNGVVTLTVDFKVTQFEGYVEAHGRRVRIRTKSKLFALKIAQGKLLTFIVMIVLPFA